jgi:plastocyanin
MRPRLALTLLAGIAVIAGTLGDEAFVPNPYTESIAVQSEVVWRNTDVTTHTIVSDEPLFESGVLNNGDTYEFNFTAPGTYTYHCSIHPGMVGTITIDP